MVRKAPIAAPITGSINGTPEQEAYLEKIVKQFTITPNYLEKICTHFMSEMEKGLNKEGQTLAMIPSYVEGRLTGKKKSLILSFLYIYGVEGEININRII